MSVTPVTKPPLESVVSSPIDTLDPTERQKRWAEIWLPTIVLIGVLIIMVVLLMAYVESINGGGLKSYKLET